jgi:hypothetical protein
MSSKPTLTIDASQLEADFEYYLEWLDTNQGQIYICVDSDTPTVVMIPYSSAVELGIVDEKTD